MGKLVVCFDLATLTGVCTGEVGSKPQVDTWDLKEGGKERPERLHYLFELFDEFFRLRKPDIAYCEAPLSVAAMYKIGTKEETALFLRGAVGVFEAAAARAGIESIGQFDVKDARQHFVGRRTFPRKNGKSTAKSVVVNMCLMMGYKVSNDNEADAVAGWSYVCSLQNPRLAVLTTPLFR